MGQILTTEFGRADRCAMHGESALPVYLIRRDGSVIPFATNGPKPAAGETVVALLNPKVRPQTAPIPVEPSPGDNVE